MKDLYIGDFVPEDDGLNSAGGILGEQNKEGSSDDLLSRVFLAIGAFAVMIYLYLSIQDNTASIPVE